MTDVDTLRRYFERALALAHAALDDPSADRVAAAYATGADALALAARHRPAATTLADGHTLLTHASRLRALLELLDGGGAQQYIVRSGNRLARVPV
jgi:hypothetical protein